MLLLRALAHTCWLTPLYPYPQQLESLCWGRGGSSIISSHSDGSYAIWSTDTGSPPALQPTVVTTPYGEHWGGLIQGWGLEGQVALKRALHSQIYRRSLRGVPLGMGRTLGRGTWMRNGRSDTLPTPRPLPLQGHQQDSVAEL